MKTKTIKMFTMFLIYLSLLIFQACAFDRPEEIFSAATGTATPVISTINPDSAVNGITKITISGEHFIAEPNANFVYFGTNKGQVISAQANQLIVERPVTISGEFMIKVVTRDSYSSTESGPYKLEQGIVQVGEADEYNVITADKDGNLYAEKDKIISKIALDGSITEFATPDFSPTCMRFGTDGFMYLQRRNNRDLYRIPAEGGDEERFTRLAKRVSVFDFDSDGYIYSGGDKEGLFVTNPDGSNSTAHEGYKNLYAIKTVRVYDGYVYLVADTLLAEEDDIFSTVFKHQILGGGLLGERIEVLNWATTGAYSQSLIYDITFADDGAMLVATENEQPILKVQPDASIQPLYPNLLTGPAYQLFWANNYLYYVLTAQEAVDSGIIRVIMGQNGAVYHGLQ